MKIIISLLLLSSSILHSESATVAFVGDVNFTGRIGEQMAVSGTSWPFEKVKDILATADYRVANLESPAGIGGYKYCDKRVYFKANPKYLEALTYAGFNMVSLANNHALDYGPDILRQTREKLDELNIKYIGIRDNNKDHYVPKIVIINNLKIAFFGYCNACPSEFGPQSNTAGVNVGMKKMIKQQVALVKHYFNPDFIVAMPHWGSEYAGVDKNQEFTRNAMLEAGVDVIVGHHPHVLQKTSSTLSNSGEKKIVAHSLGNFLFPMRWQISLDSGILFVNLHKTKTNKDITTSFVPVSLDTNRPIPVDPESERFKRDMYINNHGYDYPDDRRWPKDGPWNR